jgi:hypothetical protein
VISAAIGVFLVIESLQIINIVKRPGNDNGLQITVPFGTTAFLGMTMMSSRT